MKVSDIVAFFFLIWLVIICSHHVTNETNDVKIVEKDLHLISKLSFLTNYSDSFVF
jgi:hypothetical protein